MLTSTATIAALWFAVYGTIATVVFVVAAMDAPNSTGKLENDIEAYMYTVDTITYCYMFAGLPCVIGLIVALVGACKVHSPKKRASPETIDAMDGKTRLGLPWLGLLWLAVLCMLSLVGVPVLLAVSGN